jgi:hypothetical protein
MSARGLNLLVFRDGRRQVSGAELRLALLGQFKALSEASSVDLPVDLPVDLLVDLKTGAVLRAGELECAVADAPGCCALPFAELTDALADALLTGQLSDHFQNIKEAALRAPLPVEMSVSVPEGFAYYDLHPLAYSRALDQLPLPPERVVVIGIRSIGATLSAVTAAGARLRGSHAIRFTVRPGGHPYNRHTEFSAKELQIIQSGISSAAGFLVVDEGPGLSGSSFLSVAEALEKAGVAHGRIVLLCAHEPNAEALCSTNAAHRWRRFRCVPAAGDACPPARVAAFVGGGQWRSRVFKDEPAWPAVWSNMERAKYLAPEGQELRLFKFAGFGHYGDRVLERERQMAAAGFAPMPRRESSGFVSYPWLDGRPMTASDLSYGVIARLAEYCAFRAKALPASSTDLHSLQEMAVHNLCELGFDLPVSLKLECPVIADGHMQPHEWIVTSDGKLLKTDCGSHGDDHFYPGPTDIAWDLAGAIVEWRMNAVQSAELLDAYRHTSGDDPHARITDFIRAYAVFRCAYCKMAANAMQGAQEQARLEQAAADYAALLRAEPERAAQNATQSAPASLAL